MKVREHARIEKCPRTGVYYVKTNSGSISYYSNYEDAKSYANYINSEDSDYQRWIDVPSPTERNYDEERWEKSRQMYEEKIKREAEKREKEQKKLEDNRKSKRSNEKYVYVISLFERGKGGYTQYFNGETNLLKMETFTTCKETDAKVFQTKASAQKVVDMLNKNYLVKKLYRNMNVIQKKRELFAKS